MEHGRELMSAVLAHGGPSGGAGLCVGGGGVDGLQLQWCTGVRPGDATRAAAGRRLRCGGAPSYASFTGVVDRGYDGGVVSGGADQIWVHPGPDLGPWGAAAARLPP